MARPRELSDGRLLKILNFIGDGQDRKRILAILNKTDKVPNNTLGRWLEFLEGEGELIIRIPRTRPQIYELTYKGGQRLTELRNSIILENPEKMESQKVIYSLEGYSVMYEVHRAGEIFTPTVVQMTNWLQRIDNWRDCNIRLNERKDGTPISLTIEPLSMMGEDRDRLLHKARAICDSGARLLERQFGFQLGPGEINKDFTIERADHITKALHDEFGYVKGKLDASKLGGELSFSGREPAEVSGQVQAWEDIPKQQSIIRDELRYLHAQNDLLTEAVANLIHSEAQTREELRKLLGVLGTTTPEPESDPLPDDIKQTAKPNDGMEVA